MPSKPDVPRVKPTGHDRDTNPLDVRRDRTIQQTHNGKKFKKRKKKRGKTMKEAHFAYRKPESEEQFEKRMRVSDDIRNGLDAMLADTGFIPEMIDSDDMQAHVIALVGNEAIVKINFFTNEEEIEKMEGLVRIPIREVDGKFKIVGKPVKVDGTPKKDKDFQIAGGDEESLYHRERMNRMKGVHPFKHFKKANDA